MASQILESDLVTWIVDYVADFCDIAPEKVDLQTPFTSYGLDSADRIVISGALEDHFDVSVDLGIFVRNADIASLVAELKTTGLIAG